MRDELGRFTGYEGPVTPLMRVEDPYAPDPRTVLKLVRPDMDDDYTAEDDARDTQADLDYETAAAWDEAHADALFYDEMLDRGMTWQEIADMQEDAERWYEDYSTYRGMVGL